MSAKKKNAARVKAPARISRALDLCAEMLERTPLDETEKALNELELSWAHFAYGVRTGNRLITSANRRHMRAAGLLKVHLQLEDYAQRVAEGERAAAFYALIECAEENVPLPYWLADELLNIGRELVRELKPDEEPNGLHDLFGLAELYPVGGKKAAKARRDKRLRGELWSKVHELISNEALLRIGGKLDGKTALKWQEARRQVLASGVDRFITDARALLKFPYGQRKSRGMFEEQERIQSRYLNASKEGAE